MDTSSLFWIGFSILVVIMLTIDLFLVGSVSKKRNMKTNILWSIIWIGTALLFNAVIFFFYRQPENHRLATEFLTAYLVEKSLSIDNLFVFLMIFVGMQTPEENRPKILKWGILTAIIMRIFFIFAGVELLHQFKFLIYIFGGILIWAAYKMAWGEEDAGKDIASHPVIHWMKKHFRLWNDYTGDKFIARKNGILYITPLLITLVIIEISDLVFAIDSIPAVLSVSRDFFIVITSNIFAILGLRALYFVAADLIGRFVYLKQGVGAILLFVGIKMLISEFINIPTNISLLIITLCLVFSLYFSWKVNLVTSKETLE